MDKKHVANRALVALWFEAPRGSVAEQSGGLLKIDIGAALDEVHLLRMKSLCKRKPGEVRRESLLGWDYTAWKRYQSVRTFTRHLPDFPCPIKPEDPEPRTEWQMIRDAESAAWRERLREDPALAQPLDRSVSLE